MASHIIYANHLCCQILQNIYFQAIFWGSFWYTENEFIWKYILLIFKAYLHSQLTTKSNTYSLRGCEVVNGFNILRLPYLEIISPVFKNIVHIDIFSTGLLFYGRIRPQTKKICKTLHYFWFPPNLAHRKLIDLANYVPSSSLQGVLSFTQPLFQIL